MLEGIVYDLRYAFRVLRRAPRNTAIAVAILGLGIGANTAMFSAINHVLLRPLPFADSDRLLRVRDAVTSADGQRARLQHVGTACRRAARAEPGVRRDSGVQRRQHDADGRRRAGADERRAADGRRRRHPRRPPRGRARLHPRRVAAGDRQRRRADQRRDVATPLRPRRGGDRRNAASRWAPVHRDRRHAAAVRLPVRGAGLGAVGARRRRPGARVRRVRARASGHARRQRRATRSSRPRRSSASAPPNRCRTMDSM